MKIKSKLVLISIGGILIAFNTIVESLSYFVITLILDKSGEAELPFNNSIWSTIDAVLSLFLAALLFWTAVRFAQKKEHADRHYFLATIGFIAYYVLSKAADAVFLSSVQSWPLYFISFIVPMLVLAALLGAILWSRKYYALEEQELYRPSEKPMGARKIKSFVWLSFISMVFPLVIFCLWIYASTREPVFEDAVAFYHSMLPTFLTPRNNPTYFSLIFCLLALIFAFNGREVKGRWMRFVLIFSVVISSLLILLNLFALM